jgi:hypothetical protein
MWLSDDFSGVETMVLYALENLVMLTLALIGVRLLAPRFRWRESAFVGYGFCPVTSIFIGFFTFGMLPGQIAAPDVAEAMKSVVVLLLIGFAIDLIFLRQMTLIGAERLMRNSLGRIMVVQFLGVFWGVFCAALFSSFVLPFIILETLFELGKIHEFFFGPKTDAEYLKHMSAIKGLKYQKK